LTFAHVVRPNRIKAHSRQLNGTAIHARRCRSISTADKMNDKDGFQGRAEGEIAEQALARIAEQQIIQTAKTKRFLIAMVGFMFVVAALVILLAPDGREKTAIWLGIVLAILALGIIGCREFFIRVPGFTVDTRGRLRPERQGTRGRRDRGSPHQAGPADKEAERPPFIQLPQSDAPRPAGAPAAPASSPLAVFHR
jgi:hypothetical protein